MSERSMLELIDRLPVSLILVNSDGEAILFNKLSLALTQKMRQRELFENTMDGDPFDFKNAFWSEKIRRCLRDGETEFVENKLSLICKMKTDLFNPLHIWISLTEADRHKKAFTTAYDEMVQTSKVKEMSEMAAGIAHEIINPLTVIYAKTHFLTEFLEKGTNSDAVTLLEHIGKIHQNSERIFKIVSGMRSFSRDAKHDSLVEYPVHKLVAEALSLMNGRIQILGVEVQVSSIPDYLTIKCWPSLLLQVLLNLFKNAIESVEAMPFPKLKIDIETIENKLLFYISDSGPGVSLENEAKIFLPFFTTKAVGLGTGIGLSLSAKIIADHSGKLRLERSRGNSCFVFDIPLHLQSQKQA